MSAIRNLNNLSMDEIYYAVQQGGKFVRFRYCVSYIVGSMEQESAPYFLRPGENPHKFSRKFNTITSLFGWCSLTGAIGMAHAYDQNKMGGQDITREVILDFERQMRAQGIPFQRPAGFVI